MMMKYFSIICLVAVVIASCSPNSSNNKQVSQSVKPDSVYCPEYANRFTIQYYKDHKIIEVAHPWDTLAAPYRIVLSSDSVFLKNNPLSIETPVKRWVSVASTQICYANELNVLNTLVGMAEPEYVSNKFVIDGIKSGSIKNVGTAYAPDMEVVLSLAPEIMMVSPFKDDYYGPLREAGVNVVTNCSYLENTPLGRVEWLVYFSAFFNKEKDALKKVADIATKYKKVKSIALNALHKPTIFSGKVFQGIWYAPAAQSYKANFFKDAGVNYIFNDREGVGALTYDFETVYEAAGNCDYWTLLVNYPAEYSYSVLEKDDARYADFKAFKDKNVFYSNTNDSKYYEEGLLKPEVILSDFVKLFHPELLTDYEPVFYKKLIKE